MSNDDIKQAWDEVERSLVELADVRAYSRHTVTLAQSCASLVRELRKACEAREAELAGALAGVLPYAETRIDDLRKGAGPTCPEHLTLALCALDGAWAAAKGGRRHG